MVIEVTDETFRKEVLESDIPTEVDFLGTLVWALPYGFTNIR